MRFGAPGHGDGVPYDGFHNLFVSESAHSPVSAHGVLSVGVKINNRCRFKCLRCQSDNEAGCTDYPADGILKVLGALAPVRLVWCGGETLLSPRLGQYIEDAAGKGFFNIVTTHMILGDRLGHLAGKFHYEVDILGLDRQEFKNHTGWDLFKPFQRHFPRLFDLGHAVTVSMVVQAGWRDDVPRYIHWLEDYPIRRLLILNPTDAGAKVHATHWITENEIAEMKDLVEKMSPKFPVVFPLPWQIESIGAIVIVPSPDRVTFAMINGEKIQHPALFLTVLTRLVPGNIERHGRQAYYLPH